MTEETKLLLPIYSFYFILLLPGSGRAPHASGWGGVPRTLPLPMEGVKLLRDGPLAKAAFFCCDFVKFCLTFPQKMTNICKVEKCYCKDKVIFQMLIILVR